MKQVNINYYLIKDTNIFHYMTDWRYIAYYMKAFFVLDVRIT